MFRSSKAGFVLALVLLLLGGCANNGADVVSRMPQGLKIAPLSLMGDALIVRSASLLAFGDDEIEIGLPDWDIDRHLEGQVSEILAESGRFQSVGPARPEIRDWFGPYDLAQWKVEPGVTGGLSSLAEYGRARGADAVLLIAPGTVSSEIFLGGDLYEPHKGYGIFQSETLVLERTAKYYVVLQLFLIDTASGEQIAQGGEAQSAPATYGDWIDEDTPLTIAQQDRIHTGLRDLFEFTLGNAMAEIALR